MTVYTDSNWGPQDASKPMDEAVEKRTVLDHEAHLVQGFVVARSGGPIAWKVIREKRISRSSCEAEIKAMDGCTKEIQYLRPLLQDLGEADGSTATPVYNDNQGAIQWTQTGSLTQKKLRHLNIRELAVLEARKAGEIDIRHIPGRINPGDMFTKEDRDQGHLRDLRDMVMHNCDQHGGC